MVTESVLSEKELAAAFESVLTGIPVKSLEAFITQAKLVAGGMRFGKPGNTLFIRKVILNAYGGKLLKYDTTWATLVRTYMPEARLLTMLSAEELTRRRGQFTVFFGKARLILALLVDTREEIRTEALKWMSESGAELPDEATAQSLVREAFAPVAEAGKGAAEGAGNKQLRTELSEMKQKLEELEKKAKRERRALEEEHSRTLREQKDLLASKDFAIDDCKRRVAALEGQLAREKASLDLHVNELLALRRIELFGGWLKPVFAVETLLEEAKALPLLERAEAILEAQRKADRASARRHEAEAHLKALEAMLDQVEHTLASAQHILPEMLALRDELQTQCEAYRAGLMTELDTFSAVAKELAARIDATTEADYTPVRDWLRLSKQLGAITPTEAKALYERFHRRATQWADANPNFKPEDIGLDTETESDAIRRRNPVLAAALAGQGAMILFLDGHNMLNGLSRYRQRRSGKPQTHEDARSRLERDMNRQFEHLPLVSVNLVWDGAEQTSHNEGVVLVHYSGGSGEHRADRYIVNQIDYVKSLADTPIVLVTDDNGFAGEAAKRGVQICKLHDFEAFLDVPLA